jgi:hypothetical protein
VKVKVKRGRTEVVSAIINGRHVTVIHLAAEKVTLALEGIGAGKVRVNSSSLDQPLRILPAISRRTLAHWQRLTAGIVIKAARSEGAALY